MGESKEGRKLHGSIAENFMYTLLIILQCIGKICIFLNLNTYLRPKHLETRMCDNICQVIYLLLLIVVHPGG